MLTIVTRDYSPYKGIKAENRAMKSTRARICSIALFATALVGTGMAEAAKPASPVRRPPERPTAPSGTAFALPQQQAASVPDLQAAPGTPLSASELLAISVPIRQFRPRDAFDAPPPTPFKQRTFRVELAVRPGGESSRSCEEPFWRYNADSGKLDLALSGDLEMLNDFRHYNDTTFGLSAPLFPDAIPTAIDIRCSEKQAGSYLAGNAFGATTEVSRINVVKLELIDARNLVPILLESVPKPPAEAKQLVPSLRFVVEGEVEEWSPGQSLICGLKQTQPNMDSPYEVRTDFCALKVAFLRASFVDSRSGHVVAVHNFPQP